MKAKKPVEHTARFRVVLMIDHPVAGRTMEEALTAARAAKYSNVVGLDVVDYEMTLQAVEANVWMDSA